MLTETVNWNAVYTSCLASMKPEMVDAASTSNRFWYMITKKGGGYKTIDAPGQRAEIALMYDLNRLGVYEGYDTLPQTPIDGVTAAFYDWRQGATPIMISGKEERQNKGDRARFNMLKTKIKQAKLGVKEDFARYFLQGQAVNDGVTIMGPYVDPLSGRRFVDPLAFLVQLNPAAAGTIGGLNQVTEVNSQGTFYWRNQFFSSVAATWAAWRSELEALYMRCDATAGGAPSFHLLSPRCYSMYGASLRVYHVNESYTKADLPFENLLFKGSPVTYEARVPDVATGNLTETTGTWFMLNPEFWEIQVESDCNFSPTEFQKPSNADYKLAHLLWFGAACVSNRQKQGVLGNINIALVA